MDGAAADATGGGDGVFEGVWEVRNEEGERCLKALRDDSR